MPIMRCASTAGTSSKKLESGGVAPMSSPAVSVRVLGLAWRSAFQYAEMTAAPPTPLIGSSWPCQSDTFKIWRLTVGCGAALTLIVDIRTAAIKINRVKNLGEMFFIMLIYTPLAKLTYNQTAAWANAQPSILIKSTELRPSPPPFVKDLQTEDQSKRLTRTGRDKNRSLFILTI